MKSISPKIFFKMAGMSLRRHPIRSFLALLGIIIGIASMTITMAVGEGANERLKKEILAMGENWIYILPGNVLTHAEVRKTKGKRKELKYDDYLALQHYSSSIQGSTPCIEYNEVVKYQGEQLVAEIQGVNEDFFHIEPRGIKLGMPFSFLHDHVAVLGSEVAKELFKQDDPIGKTILIGKYSFKVIGVFNEAPKKINRLRNPNLNVVIPFSIAWKKMDFHTDDRSIHRIIVSPKSTMNANQLISSLRRLLRFKHHLADEEPDDFTIWDLQAMMQAAHEASKVFNQFLLIAASASLVVGGIGIMNVMLVAMTERKKEIGIKMALGATSSHILAQFLVESTLLCVAGGILGILAGLTGTYILGVFIEFDWAIRPMPLLIAFGTTLVVGLFFGFYPARKASKLHPVAALQSF